MNGETKFAERGARRITKRIMKGLMFFVFAMLALALFGLIVMKLWNWLTPALFGLHEITYWQAVGVLILSKILFGGFRGGHGRHGEGKWRQRRMLQRWAQMTPEEREKFRAEMRGCGFGEEPAAKPTT